MAFKPLQAEQVSAWEDTADVLIVGFGGAGAGALVPKDFVWVLMSLAGSAGAGFVAWFFAFPLLRPKRPLLPTLPSLLKRGRRNARHGKAIQAGQPWQWRRQTSRAAHLKVEILGSRHTPEVSRRENAVRFLSR